MRVWLWGMTNRKRTFFEYGETLESFMEYCTTLRGATPLVYFHNLRFDGSYILVWLLNNGYKWTDRIEEDGEFSSVITDTGLFYEISFGVNGKQIRFHDSAKKIPLRLEDMPKAYGLDIEKLDLDYDAVRDYDHVATQEEIDYQVNDVYIPAEVLDIQYTQGLTKMTSSADAMEDYKNRIGKTKFNKLYPMLSEEIDTFCRNSYKGGYTIVRKGKHGKEVKKGYVYDVHSMYPGQMKKKLLPYGMPVYLQGEINKDILSEYPLYIVHIKTNFVVKEDYLPTIQIKNDIQYSATEYLEASNKEVDLYLTSVDYELFKDHYDTFYLEEVGAYYFKGAYGLFDDYIDYWYSIKEDPKSPKALVTLAKLKLNGLYGKFGTNPENTIKVPYLSEDGVLKFKAIKQPPKKSVYVPMASFITAYARDYIIRSAQSVYHYFCYSDTDSIHMEALPQGEDIHDYLDITDSEIGTWGHESDFDKAVFYRAKTYKEYINGEAHIKCAGLKASAFMNGGDGEELTLDQMDFDDFQMGVVFEQLKSRQSKGGMELYLAPFEVK